MTTYSTSLKLALIADGGEVGLWGQTTNTNLGTLLEQAITGTTSINMADANVTLTSLNGATDQARNQVLILTGTNNGVRDVIPPVVKKTYIVVNNTTGGYAIRVIGSSGTGVNVPNGTTSIVYCNGTSFFEAINSNTITGNSTISGNLSVGGTTALSGALTYGGVALSNAVTGTGNMVLSASPALTGTPIAPTAAPGTNTTQIATTAFVVQNAVPTGSIVMWGTGSAPSGWLICDGSSVSTTTYANLYAVIGYTFGGSGGNFLLPNYNNRFPVGAGDSYVIGATGGSADAIVVSHTHNLTDPGHTHTLNNLALHTDTVSGGPIPIQTRTNNPNTTSVQTASTGITIDSAGSSGVNANLPPYLGIRFIIKT